MNERERPEPVSREPYERPQVVWEETLDERPGLIAACNKVEPLSGTCDTGSLSS